MLFSQRNSMVELGAGIGKVQTYGITPIEKSGSYLDLMGRRKTYTNSFTSEEVQPISNDNQFNNSPNKPFKKRLASIFTRNIISEKQRKELDMVANTLRKAKATLMEDLYDTAPEKIDIKLINKDIVDPKELKKKARKTKLKVNKPNYNGGIVTMEYTASVENDKNTKDNCLEENVNEANISLDKNNEKMDNLNLEIAQLVSELPNTKRVFRADKTASITDVKKSVMLEGKVKKEENKSLPPKKRRYIQEKSTYSRNCSIHKQQEKNHDPRELVMNICNVRPTINSTLKRMMNRHKTDENNIYNSKFTKLPRLTSSEQRNRGGRKPIDQIPHLEQEIKEAQNKKKVEKRAQRVEEETNKKVMVILDINTQKANSELENSSKTEKGRTERNTPRNRKIREILPKFEIFSSYTPENRSSYKKVEDKMGEENLPIYKTLRSQYLGCRKSNSLILGNTISTSNSRKWGNMFTHRMEETTSRHGTNTLNPVYLSKTNFISSIKPKVLSPLFITNHPRLPLSLNDLRNKKL